MADSNEGLRGRWLGLGQGARIASIGAAVLTVSLAIWLAFFALRERYGVLFSDLAPADAAAIVAELKDRKIPYRLQQNGKTIVVPEGQVHDVRLQLMSSELPLNGGVGFEIFDKQGLGATENSQRVSYQRALQGELSRTIGTLEHVKGVRVHLVLPQSSLFTKDRQEATAAITLALDPGATLERQQILGVQRLVAAAVPGLAPERVVITNQRGVTLSSSDEAGAGAADARLEIKRRIEEYVTRKVVQLLDRAYGPGQAIVSVDATINFDASKKTLHDLVPVTNAHGAPEGMVVRRRQLMSGQQSDSIWTTTDAASPTPPSSSSVEVEYEYGKRMEEVISSPGNVTRLSIGIIVPESMSEQNKQKIAEIVQAAAGVDATRGDTLSVQTLLDLGGSMTHEASSDAQDERASTDVETSVASPQLSTSPPIDPKLAAAMGGGVLLLLFLFALVARGTRTTRLSEADRERLLREIQAALNEPATERVLGRP
jgi:flagellar M-ring protein FliF